ncbi:MAG: TetR/AcrR family transcriptional regulator [Cyanobacteria bacterium J06639_18]
MPKIVDHEQYRKELLWKSFDLFAQKGYASITMREIAKEIGVSTGTLYHYFPNKEALFLQLIEEQTEQDLSDFLTEGQNAETLSERIDILIDFIAKNEDYFINQTLIYFDFYQQQGKTTVLNNKILQTVQEKTRQELSKYLQIQDRVLASFTMNMVSGLLIGRMFEGDVISYKEQGELLKKMLGQYLGVKNLEN